MGTGKRSWKGTGKRSWKGGLACSLSDLWGLSKCRPDKPAVCMEQLESRKWGGIWEGTHISTHAAFDMQICSIA
jgi:hypothetical protein